MKNLKAPLILLLISGLSAYLCFYFYFAQRARYRFPTVEATIDSVYFASYRPSGKDYTIQSANFAYTYSIKAKQYSGSATATDRYGEEMTITSGTFGKQVIEELKSQKNVTVFYDPEDPSDSFITPEVSVGLLVGGIIASLFVLLGFVALYTALFSKRQNYMLNEDQAKQVVDGIRTKYRSK